MGITCSSNSNHNVERTMQTTKQRCTDVDNNHQALERCAVCYEQSIRLNKGIRNLPMPLIDLIFKYFDIEHHSIFPNDAALSFKQHTFSLSKDVYDCRDDLYWDWQFRKITTNCEVFNDDMIHGAKNKIYQFTFKVSGYCDTIGISTRGKNYLCDVYEKGIVLSRNGARYHFPDKRERALYRGVQLTLEIRYDDEKQVWLRFKRFGRWYSLGNIGVHKDISIEVSSPYTYTNVFKSIKFIGFKAF